MSDILDRLRRYAYQWRGFPDGEMATLAAREIYRLRTRLEWRPDGYDGIYCRNQTIEQQDKAIDDLRAENAKLRDEAEAAQKVEIERQAAIGKELERLRGIARASGRL